MGNLAEMAAGDTEADADALELTVVLPCLNEAETVALCVSKAVGWIRDAGVAGEVIVADNGSTDDSPDLARAAGARVVTVRRKGYGNALIAGIRAARGRYVLMADADDSYDLENLGPFLQRLRAGDDLVMGNRFAGGIEPGAMPWLHRRIGNPVLSGIGRLFFRTPVRDFHCGIRAFRKDAIMDLGLRAGGMEFASEMIVKASLADLKISEVPTTLRPDGRSPRAAPAQLPRRLAPPAVPAAVLPVLVVRRAGLRRVRVRRGRHRPPSPSGTSAASTSRACSTRPR